MNKFLIFLLLFLSLSTCAGTGRVGAVSVMNYNNDLGVLGNFVITSGFSQGKHSFSGVVKTAGGLNTSLHPAGSGLAGLEYKNSKHVGGFRFTILGGVEITENSYNPKFEIDVGLFEFFKGKYRKFGALAFEMSAGKIWGNLPYSGFWYGVGLSWQYEFSF